jgi:ribosomal protein L16/L10AE
MPKKLTFKKSTRQNKPKHTLGKIPKKTKFKRLHKGRIAGFEFNQANYKLMFGVFGLKILKQVKLKLSHLNSIRNTLFRRKLLKRQHNHML